MYMSYDIASDGSSMKRCVTILSGNNKAGYAAESVACDWTQAVMQNLAGKRITNKFDHVICVRPPPPPVHSPHHPFPPPLAFPLTSEVDNMRFRAFKKKRVTDGRTD